MNEKKGWEKRRRIIIGLTGPVGSGCTELAKVFDEPKNIERDIDKCALFNFLTNERYIEIDWNNKKIKPLHLKIDSEIATLFQKIEILRDTITLTKDSVTIKELQIKQRVKFNDLKDKLEYRETLKSLDDLAKYIDFNQRKHHFTSITLSDLIIFNVLCNYKKKPLLPKDEDKEKGIKRFLEIVIEKELEINNIIDEIRELLPKTSNLHGMRRLLRRKIMKPEHIEKTATILRNIVKLSENIKDNFKKKYKEDYRTLMQDFGDNIRRCGNPFNYNTPYNKDKHIQWCRDIKDIINFLYYNRGHSFFILDSFRNPYEVKYFQERFTDFYLIALNASGVTRQKRVNFNENSELRDQGKKVKKEEIFYKQHVPRTVKLSDIAINNNTDVKGKDERRNKFISKIVRYLALIFDTGCTKPSSDEVMMNLAYAMAIKSNCISKQVGAVIEGKDGYVVGAGWNDVGEGQVSCGLREIKDLRSGSYDDHIKVFLDKGVDDAIDDKDREKVIDILIKDYLGEKIDNEEIERFCFCFKDEYSKKHLREKIENINIAENCLEEIIKIGIKRLEYCQALHAEENAIIQGSKIGGMGLQGARIYTTAFPCELCAKKIQQVGINKIIYTEPYTSISEQIYLKSHFRTIKLKQFEGVMPRGYFKLFKVVEEQKEWQDLRSREFVD
jgi:deoxycytidylate deaminase